MRRPCLLLYTLLLGLLPRVVGATPQAQPTPPPPKPAKPAPKPPAVKSPNVKTGEIVAVNLTEAILTLRATSGQTAEYELNEKTRYLKDKKAVSADVFKVGETVVAHLRKPRKGDRMVALTLADPMTWAWYVEKRRVMTQAVLAEIGENTLTASMPAEGTTLTYTYSAKTVWCKGAQEVESDSFKSGEQVYIVPRALPSGAIMARIVADTPTGAAIMKERQARSVHGVVQTLDNKDRALTLATIAGDTRALLFAENVEVRQSGKPLPLTAVKVGANVAASLKRDAAGALYVWRITLEKPQRAKPPQKPASADNTKRT